MTSWMTPSPEDNEFGSPLPPPQAPAAQGDSRKPRRRTLGVLLTLIIGFIGGLVGTLGALGGFLLPPLFVYVRGWTGLPQSTFVVLFLLTLIATVWMHVVIVKMLHKASPALKNQIDYHNSQKNGD